VKVIVKREVEHLAQTYVEPIRPSFVLELKVGRENKKKKKKNTVINGLRSKKRRKKM
jgi:hypothetical protein